MSRIVSLFRYVKLFENWPIAATARYLGNRLGGERTLDFRDGRKLIFRPGSDSVAMGEIFVADGYAECVQFKNVRLVWDIGGNIGAFVIWAAKQFPEASFESFEPCAPTYSILERNAACNPAIRWKTNPYGLSDVDEVVNGFVPSGMFGETSKYATAGIPVSLPLRSINQVWEEHGSPSIDLLKIDCEGGEYDIVGGIQEEFLRSVRALIMEFHAIEGRHPQQLRDRLVASGFEVHWPDGPQGVAWAVHR